VEVPYRINGRLRLKTVTVDVRKKVDQRNIPPRWEGLDAGKKLGPYEEPRWYREMGHGGRWKRPAGARVWHGCFLSLGQHRDGKPPQLPTW
jgi:hypothetical protein